MSKFKEGDEVETNYHVKAVVLAVHEKWVWLKNEEYGTWTEFEADVTFVPKDTFVVGKMYTRDNGSTVYHCLTSDTNTVTLAYVTAYSPAVSSFTEDVGAFHRYAEVKDSANE